MKAQSGMCTIVHYEQLSGRYAQSDHVEMPGTGCKESMIRKSMPSGHDPMGGYRFSLGTNAKRLPGDHAQTKNIERDDDSKKSHPALGTNGQGETAMASEDNGAFIRNIAEVPWREFPNHFGGALSKPLVMPETAGSRHLDYRISMYQPMARVARHKHQVQEQIYHVLEGEGLMEIAGKNHVVRKHDFIFLPPGVEHAISNSGLVDLVFLVITSPVTDDSKIV